MDDIWTLDTSTALINLVGRGVSATEAGKHLGCSRNAAIGKAIRLGLRFGKGMTPEQRTLALQRAAEVQDMKAAAS